VCRTCAFLAPEVIEEFAKLVHHSLPGASADPVPSGYPKIYTAYFFKCLSLAFGVSKCRTLRKNALHFVCENLAEAKINFFARTW
jgi:hypothetical protein